MRIVSKYMHTHSAQQFVESIDEFSNNQYYVTIGRHTPFTSADDGAISSTVPASDINIPTPSNDDQTVHFKYYNNLIFGKKINQQDVSLAVPINTWTENTVYQRYERSVEDLEDQNYYVNIKDGSDYHIFKCLDNNNGANSTSSPSLPSGNTIIAANGVSISISADNYIWKYMYTITSAQWTKFATTEFMPVVENVLVKDNSVNGSIEAISVTNAGVGYNAHYTGKFEAFNGLYPFNGDASIYGITKQNNGDDPPSSTDDFYRGSALTITNGTGQGQTRNVTAYGITSYNDGGTIKTFYKVTLSSDFSVVPDGTSVFEISPRVIVVGDGSNAAARAVVNATSNTIHQVVVTDKGSDYSYAAVSFISGGGTVTVNATAAPVMSPPGGHGSDVHRELGAKHVCVSKTFDPSSDIIPALGDFRTIAVLKDPTYANVQVNFSASTGNFDDNEIVVSSSGVVTMSVRQENGSSFLVANTDERAITGESSSATANVISASPTTVVANVASGTFRVNEFIQLDANTNIRAQVTSIYNNPAEGVVTDNTDSANSLKMKSVKGKFIPGQTVYGSNSGATATISAANFVKSNHANNTTSSYARDEFVQLTKVFVENNTGGAFTEDGYIRQSELDVEANGMLLEEVADGGGAALYLTNTQGNWTTDDTVAGDGQIVTDDATSHTYANTTAVVLPDLDKDSGEVLYIENIRPITRNSDQTETFKVVIEF